MKADDVLFEGLEIKDPRLAWSRGARPFSLEGGDYFPIMEIVKVWLEEFGWDGWVSMEGFLEETKMEGNEFGPEAMARRGWGSWEKIKAGLDRG
jgi:4-hydroxyphenylpyruvate dioxygenase